MAFTLQLNGSFTSFLMPKGVFHCARRTWSSRKNHPRLLTRTVRRSHRGEPLRGSHVSPSLKHRFWVAQGDHLCRLASICLERIKQNCSHEKAQEAQKNQTVLGILCFFVAMTRMKLL